VTLRVPWHELLSDKQKSAVHRFSIIMAVRVITIICHAHKARCWSSSSCDIVLPLYCFILG
jgi:hypothetical protein